jgi:hypothetical protein
MLTLQDITHRSLPTTTEKVVGEIAHDRLLTPVLQHGVAIVVDDTFTYTTTFAVHHTIIFIDVKTRNGVLRFHNVDLLFT